mmetsp:Transcript_3850/g.7957  ORF Transcript_3850/g.7957 Transcript_3850/m.7957 type:complete len:222 (-) Transcript_3850:331-996(-)|eukprot:CAMPEP_0118934812 /NCGR_PEP_ID=MMETSP1169-20130426/14209_1 /TAXON_ID=36882 /ORGANISM="Pyramimonas obovata, Strain CCMP722" /LENGTH=221 /DNA_ID=CAMNT_0006877751 /DNA_START=133 /DNA_END=798 /DNA_ORIENTATION=-
MNDADYARQIQQMVEFIKQEANEKANEIRVAADEEFNIQKLNLVEAEKVKIRKDYERKAGQIEVKKKIEYSTQLNASRLRLLQARDDFLNQTLTAASASLGAIVKDQSGYKKLLVQLIVQGVNKLHADNVVVRCRKEDLSACKAAIEDTKSQWSSLASGPCPKFALDEQKHLPPSKGEGETCAGGVVIVAENGRISCNNTLDARLKSAFGACLPEMRAKLF